jgi:serine phosphatase RsbU (regulator of sigma subunit)
MAGKGLEAAVHIAAVKFALRALLRADSAVMPCPGSALSRLNKFVCQAHALDAWEPGALVSVALVILDTATGEGRFALAASEAPIVLQHGDPVEPDDAPVTPYGMPLGAMAWEAYEAAPIHLPDGAALLLLTDGLTEARRPERTPEGRVQFLGYEGVARLAMAAHADAGPSPSLPEVGRTLVEHTRAWAGDRLRDDVCLLLARRASI